MKSLLHAADGRCAGNSASDSFLYHGSSLLLQLTEGDCLLLLLNLNPLVGDDFG